MCCNQHFLKVHYFYSHSYKGRVRSSVLGSKLEKLFFYCGFFIYRVQKMHTSYKNKSRPNLIDSKHVFDLNQGRQILITRELTRSFKRQGKRKFTINTSDLPQHIITSKSKDVLFYTSCIQLEVLISGFHKNRMPGNFFFTSVYKSSTFKEIPIPSQICLYVFHLKVCKKNLTERRSGR